MTVKLISSEQNDHMAAGAEESKGLLDSNSGDIVALATVVVRRNGTTAWSYAHLEGPNKLALVGAMEALSSHLIETFVYD